MARFRNDTDGVLTVNDLCQQAGPREEFDFPGYDPAVHGVVTGCTRLDEPQEAAGRPSVTPSPPDSGQPAAPASGPPAAGDIKPSPAPGGAASKENQA